MTGAELRRRPTDRGHPDLWVTLGLLVAVTPAGCGGPATVDAGGSEIRVLASSMPLYHGTEKGPRQDASGIASLPSEHRVFMVDDGGDEPAPSAPFYFLDLKPDVQVISDVVASRHGDLEAATFDGTYVYVASSLSPEYTDNRFHNFSRFRVHRGVISDGTTINPRARILKALESLDGDWFARVQRLEKGKLGGLNVEGLAAAQRPNELLIGLRAPHYGPQFPGECDPKTCSKADTGDALIVAATGDFAHPELWSTTIHRLDLGGLGVRSLEYSPTAQGYFVLAGGVSDADRHFRFYFWKGPDTAPVRIELDEFAKLCRPEGVAEIEKDRRKYILLVSEDSGSSCEEPAAPFNYLLIEINAAFLAKLR